MWNMLDTRVCVEIAHNHTPCIRPVYVYDVFSIYTGQPNNSWFIIQCLAVICGQETCSLQEPSVDRSVPAASERNPHCGGKKKKKISHRPRWSVAWELIPFAAL